MTTPTQSTEYRCGICENTQWVQKTHFTSHKLTDDHKAQFKAIKKIVEKLTLDMRQTEYGETDIKKIMKKKVELLRTNKQLPSSTFTRFKRSRGIVYERSSQEIEEKRKEDEFKSLYICQLNKWHNLLRDSQVTGDDAMEDILNCLFLCYLSPRVSTEGDFDLANNEKSCYSGIVQTKIKDWISKLNIDYLIDNTAELITKKNEDSSIYKCGELMSRHPITKQLIKNKKFINCLNPITLSKLLKECNDFSKTHHIFEKIDIVGYTWEYFNTGHGGNKGTSKEFGQYFTERPVMGMCCQLIELNHLKELGIDKNSTLGDEFCATFGFPLYTKKFMKDKFDISIQDKNIYGVEYNQKLAKFGIMNAMFSLKKFTKVKCGDSYLTNVSPHLDISTHNVPMGLGNGTILEQTYNNYKIENPTLNLPDYKDIVKYNTKKGTLSTPALQLVIYKTKKMGLVITKDGEETSGGGCFKDVRKLMCDSCVIHKIMKIPRGAFSHTETKTVCIYFTKREGQKTEKIQFLEMSDTGDKITEICEVSRKDLQQNDYSWEPNAYIVDEDMEKLMASSNCEWKKLGDVCEIRIGSTPSTVETKYWDKGTHIWLSVSELNNSIVPIKNSKKKLSNIAIEECRPKLVKKNTILMSFKLSIGKVGISGCDLYTNEAILQIDTQNSTLNKFIFFYFLYNPPTNGCGSIGKGNLNKTSLSNLDIPNPPLETQAQVVKTLDDLAILRQNYMDIRDGLERRTKYYFETMIKKHRKEITMAKLGDVISINIGSTPSTNENKYWENGTHTWVSVRELNNTTIPITDSVKKITDIAISECNPQLVKKDSILMSFKLSIGKMAIAGCDLYTNEAIVHMNTDNNLYNKWLYYYYICYPPKGASGSIGGGSLNKDKLEKIEFINMPDNIKSQIVKYLDNLEAEKNKITEILKQLDTEMREILTQSYQSSDDIIQSGDDIIQSGDDIIQPIDINDELVETLQ